MSSRDRDFRPTRRRSFDDDNFEPPRHSFGSPFSAQRSEAPSGPPVKAVVKWYNPDKGFGFVQLADGSGDAFLHVSVVERSGHAERCLRDTRGPRRSRSQRATGNRNPERRQQHRTARAAQTRTTGATWVSAGRPSRCRGLRHGQVVQRDEGVWLYRLRSRRQGYLCSCFGAGAGGDHGPDGGSARCRRRNRR